MVQRLFVSLDLTDLISSKIIPKCLKGSTHLLTPDVGYHKMLGKDKLCGYLEDHPISEGG